ncbi:TlpA disulfide reductase family protein [uncultured Erythrobacter sp.]|uniref:TlpA family protein disulfide reductase n=1 Tax=uncultured Erythrobacter sp. TaxID=263913 RepID=UPI0026388BD6|nr:TlpA disulfide reductase family protein [uncultured Erythrobacter sp.]
MSRSLLIAFAPVLLLAGCDTAPEETSQRDSATSAADAPAPPPLPGRIVRAQAGTEMPELSFEDAAGNTLALADLKGKPVLLNLWATWCAPCVVEMPLLDDLATELGDEVKVLTISQDIRGAEVVTPFFAERNFQNLEPWLDPEADLAVQFTQGGLMPTTILFDAEGKELFRVAGDYEWNSEDAIAEIREAISG